MALLLAPYVLPNPRFRRKTEIQKTFICYCSVFQHPQVNLFLDYFHSSFVFPLQIDPFAEDDDEEYHQTVKRLKIESEPRIYFIGNKEHDKINHAYVDMLGLRLKFDNPLKAFEVCFHCFMAMNIPYPKTCKHVWIFLQQLIFNVVTKNDGILPIITTLINDLNSK